MWRGTESKESQSDVKQTVNVDGLFVGSSTFKIHMKWTPSKTPTFLYNSLNSGITWVLLIHQKGNQLKHLLIILSFLLLSYPLFGQSKDDCYLFVGGDIGEDKSVIDQIVRSLIGSFVSPLKEVPVDGLSQSEINSSCYYEVSVSEIKTLL